ncbi:hypothetical protein NDU88_007531 [Pleurodeles waltl]|uniref:Uncharacterized protein n=1 Tax=Pleurodeles waltl TaxID=8319 RepID=A0AAV7PQ84_PLEWA|nr:hypothetical protein NDU88_007531 [Pleurodeles waltl]
MGCVELGYWFGNGDFHVASTLSSGIELGLGQFDLGAKHLNHEVVVLFDHPAVHGSRLGMGKIVFLLLLGVALSFAVRETRQPSEWDYRSDAEKVNLKGCANLTMVLDNWKFAIMTQFKNLLLYDHHMVLPDYGRIKSLSEALDDLYGEFSHLKERLGELTTKFDGVEAFVDEMKAGRHQRYSGTAVQPEVARESSPPVSTTKRRVLVRKNKKNSESQAAESP